MAGLQACAAAQRPGWLLEACLHCIASCMHGTRDKFVLGCCCACLGTMLKL